MIDAAQASSEQVGRVALFFVGELFVGYFCWVLFCRPQQTLLHEPQSGRCGN
jgi:hypothetical protein